MKTPRLRKVEEEKVAVFAVLAHADKEARVEAGQTNGDIVVDHELVHRLVEALGLGVEVGPELGPCCLRWVRTAWAAAMPRG